MATPTGGSAHAAPIRRIPRDLEGVVAFSERLLPLRACACRFLRDLTPLQLAAAQDGGDALPGPESAAPSRKRKRSSTDLGGAAPSESLGTRAECGDGKGEVDDNGAAEEANDSSDERKSGRLKKKKKKKKSKKSTKKDKKKSKKKKKKKKKRKRRRRDDSDDSDDSSSSDDMSDSSSLSSEPSARRKKKSKKYKTVVRYSSISGKKIRMKIPKTSAEKMEDINRQRLRLFFNQTQ